MEEVVADLEAGTRFAQLLDRAEHGEEIVITREGKPVAKLVPATHPTRGSSRAHEAASRLRELAAEMNLGAFHWSEWQGYRDEGRR